MAAVGINLMGLEMTREREGLVHAIVGGVLSIISMYVGAKIQKKRDDDDKGL